MGGAFYKVIHETQGYFRVKNSEIGDCCKKNIDIIRFKTLCLVEYNPAVRTLVFNLRKAKKHTKTHHCFELFAPQAARCSEPVNSRCGCVWQGRRVGSASKVKKSRKTGGFLLFSLNVIAVSIHEVLAMLAGSARTLIFMRFTALH